MKKAEALKTTGTVVREVVDAADVSREGAALAVRTAGNLPYSPCEITAAWDLAVRGMTRVIAFGSMLCEIGDAISREVIRSSNGRIVGREDEDGGLLGWLKENCPTINYKTAMRFRRLAQITLAAARSEYGAEIEPGETATLLGILPPKNGTFSADEEKKKDILEHFLDGKSQRDVLQLWSEGGSRPGRVAGSQRPSGQLQEKTEAEILHEKRADAIQTLTTARNCLKALTTDLGKYLNPIKARPLMTDIRNDLQVVAATIEQL